MAVAFDASATGTHGTTTPLSWTHTLGGSADAIVVAVDNAGSGTNNVTSVTIGASNINIPLIGIESNTGGSFTAFYGLISPPTGAQTVKVNFTGTPSDMLGGSVSFTGAGGFSATVGTQTGGASQTSDTIAVSNTTTGGMVVVSCAFGGSPNPFATTGSGGTIRVNNAVSSTFAGDNLAVGTYPSTGGGASQTVGISSGTSSDQWALLAMEMLPSAGMPLPRAHRQRNQNYRHRLVPRQKWVAFSGFSTSVTGTVLTNVGPGGILLRVYVITGQAANPIGNTATGTGVISGAAIQASITTTAVNSIVYGSLECNSNQNSFTAVGSTTIVDNVQDATNNARYGSCKTPATVTPGTSTVGSTTNGSGEIALLEVLPAGGGTLTEDPSAPPVVTDLTHVTTSTAVFSPPAGALLVALFDGEGDGVSGHVQTVSVADSAGLTWTPQAFISTSAAGFAGVWTATVPGGIAPGGVTNPLTLSALVNINAVQQVSIGKVLPGTVNVNSSLTRSVGKTTSGTVNISGSMLRSVGKILSETVNVAASLKNSIGKKLSGTVNVTATLLAAFIHALTLSGTVNIAGTLIRSIGKLLKATVNIAASQKVTVGKILSGTVNVTASLIRSIGKILSGQVNITGTLTTIRVKLLTLLATVNIVASQKVSIGKILPGTVNVTGSAIRSVGKICSGTVNATSSLIRSVGKLLSAAVNITDTLVTIKTKLVNLATTVNVLATQKVSIGKIMGATVNVTGACINSVGKHMSGTVNATSSLIRSVGKLLAATVNITGTLVAIKATLKLLTATVNVTGSMKVSIGKMILGTVNVTESLVNRINKIMSETVNVSASVIRSCGKLLKATVNITDTLSALKATLLTLNASVKAFATQKVSIGKLIAPVVNVAGAVRMSIAKHIATAVNIVTSIVSGRPLILSTTVQATASIVTHAIQNIFLTIFKLGTVSKGWILGQVKKNWRIP